MKKWVLLCTLICATNLFAQFNFEFKGDIDISKNGNFLQNPWAGGLNFVQFSEIDYDFDGDMDLVVFDRTSDNVRLFEHFQTGPLGTYRYKYNGRQLFPSDIRYRLFLADYDLDGKNDLFTYGIGGIKVYRNTGSAASGLQWELVSNLLYSQFPFSFSNLYVSSSDIPAINDIDGDGDLDILTFSLGGSHVEYHKNLSQETYNHSDSLIFELRNQCWGKFGEDPNNSVITLFDTSAVCVSSVIPNPENTKEVNPKAHSGSTLLALDLDNNGVKDLILGDVSSPNMVKLINGGTAVNTNSAMISVEYNFPANTTPVDLQLFPGAFYLDVDFDGTKDLIVGANAKSASEDERSVLYYKNTGQNNQPNFIFQTNDFLQGEMIDHGTGSMPLFFDQNNDGKKDLIIANNFRYKPILDKESTFALYRNTSTFGNPEFTYVDDNYLDLNNLNLGLRSVPTFGDLDFDGDEDMIVARENGNLMYFKNIGTTGNAVFAPPVQPMLNNLGVTINHETFCFPQLFDLNKDNKLDLIIGKRNGTLVYYENTGSLQNPIFTLKNTQLGNVNVANISPDGYAAPHFYRHQDTTYLFCGAFDGKLHFYNRVDGLITQDSSFNLYSNNFVNIDAKGYSSFQVNDIDNDGFLDLFIGHDLGGLMHLEVDPSSNSGIGEMEQEKLIIYPNPSTGSFKIGNYTHQIRKVQLFDALGKQIEMDWRKVGAEIELIANSPTKGIYFLQVELSNGTLLNERIIIAPKN
jgi:Secretion system C-terminal sorting domain/FG-GAP-like repeat